MQSLEWAEVLSLFSFWCAFMKQVASKLLEDNKSNCFSECEENEDIGSIKEKKILYIEKSSSKL